MERYEEEGEDSDNETDPEQLLNEWLGELDSLTVVSFFNCVIIAIESNWKRNPGKVNVWRNVTKMDDRCGEEAFAFVSAGSHCGRTTRRSIGVNWRVI